MGGKLIGKVGWKAGPATMTSRAMEWAMGEGRVWGEVISCLSLWLVGQGGGMEARCSLPLGLPRPLPCPFLPLVLPLSSGLLLPLPLPLAI